ncbi:MAG: ORF6N domain-containing protein [Pyrinomonadaceae bacterium]
MSGSPTVIASKRNQDAIQIIRGERVMVDRDLAALYGVTTSVLNQAVKRHIERFPEDFMFQLTTEEAKHWWQDVTHRRLRSQTVILKRGQHLKHRPFVFTEHGILMLSSVLNSESAIKVNIEIMRAFVRFREFVTTHAELSTKSTELEGRVATHDEKIQAIFNAIRTLMTPAPMKVKQIGFRPKPTKK